MARIAKLHAGRSRLAQEQGRAPVSLDTFVFGERHLAADNGQTRLIAGRRLVPFGECSESLYEEALANIDERFEDVLLAEEPVRSVAILGRLLSVDLFAPDDARERASAAEADDGDATAERERVLELNRFDLRLYKHVRRRFDETAAEQA